MSKPIKLEEEKQHSKVFNYVPVLLVVVGLGLYYGLQINVWLKWGIFIAACFGSIASFFFLSPLGVSLHNYFRDSYREIQKVVWPTRKETVQFTWIVFLFVVVLGLFLWAIDSGLAWLLYGVVLGKGS